MAFSPPGFPGASVAQAVACAGFDGGVSFEFVDSTAYADVLDALVHGGTTFSVAVDALTDELMELLEPCADRGLSCVVIGISGARPPADKIARLKALGVEVLVRVTSCDDAEAAQACGVDGIIVKGNEAGGFVGEETTFILLQRIVPRVRIPVYAHGGVGVHTASACLVAGASGIVLDWQLALCPESDLPEEIKTRISRMDGGETAVLGQNSAVRYRAYYRVGEKAFDELYDLQSTLGVDSDASDAVLSQWRQAVESRACESSDANRLLLIGQDAAYARVYAQRYGGARAVCREIQAAALRQARLATKYKALRPDGPLAASHGTRYPVVQGPMTRVSDTADFALAVADGGALPFLALALLRGGQVEALLAETKEKLGDKPWGIGILGFVPKELREEQLAEVRKHPPPFAIIAGGRPDQARALEQESIHTYLHVPSPGLLSMFLSDGARRVIFEGRECGGHVGPRTSFVLWESMVRVMLEHLDQTPEAGERYHVLFAGGIHDAMSAAMVSAVAAPLSERGVRVGVLLGTSYLFTHEAVACGAIGSVFQQEAVACSRTVLLETGVGHATRCADTPFGKQFSDEKRRLAEHLDNKDDVRDRLEALNLGRLRIASKGIVRATDEVGDEDQPRYVRVDASAQRNEGMYMIGQVAALRDKVCSMHDLHEDVSSLSVGVLERFAPKPVTASGKRPSDIAIIGMSSMFAKADDLATYWSNILQKVNAISEIPPGRFDIDLYFDKDRHRRDKIYSRWGGFLNDLPFDPMRYGMVPNSVPSVEPMQLLVLDAVRQALEDAGYADRPFDREHTAVVLGAGGGVADLGLGYGVRSLLPHYLAKAGASPDDVVELIERLNGELPEWTEDSFAGLLINVVAGRVANRFDLGGSNYAIDAACASSLAAVRMAVNELETGAANMALVGGADTMQGPFAYLCFSKTQALSPTGLCRTFDEAGDGIVISEGIAFAVLKRLEDAERDGDRIYAVIKGIGASSDGKDKGMTAPRPEGQMRALKRAYEKAGFSPDTVGLIEAHGTGTVVGDRSEVQSLSRVFDEAGAARQNCAVGSVKSLIGHTKCAAGVAGMLKAALSLHHKILPPTGGVTTPNPKANFPESPFYINSETRPWIAREDGTPRRAGVSAFGFGGTNFHAVLEEYSDHGAAANSMAPVQQWPVELFIWRAPSADGVVKAISVLMEGLDAGAQPKLHDLAAAVCKAGANAPGDCVLAVVAEALDDLRGRLVACRERIEKGETAFHDPRGAQFTTAPIGKGGKIAFLFPGQGSQAVNMLRDLSVAFPCVRRSFEEADRALIGTWDRPLSRFVFPKPAFTDEERSADEAALTQTDVAQPALGAANVAMHRLLLELGIRADFAAGHSYGELAALCVAGVFTFEDLIRVSEARGRFMREAAADLSGTMAAVSADEATVSEAIGPIDNVWIANLNAPTQTVITGTEVGIDAALAALKQRKVSGRRIKVSCAFHSPLVAAASEKLHAFLRELDVKPPRFSVYSNTTARTHGGVADTIRQTLANHLIKPVRFADELRAMYEAGARVFVECGPGSVLSGLAEKTFKAGGFEAIAMDQTGRNGLTQLCHALARIAVSGVGFDAAVLFEGRVGQRLDLEKLVEQTKPKPLPPTTWMVNGSRAVPLSTRDDEKVKPTGKPRAFAGSSAPAGHGQQETLQTRSDTVESPASPSAGGAPNPSSASAGADAVLSSYHDLMAKFLDTQRNVMLSYLGGQHTAPGVAPPMVRSGTALELTAPAPDQTATPKTDVAPAAPNARSDAYAPSAPPAPSPIPAAAKDVDERAGDSGWTFERLSEHLVGVVGEKTGYPPEMLDIDLDLEADLGIDSIKRIEILGTLQSDAILPGDSPDGYMEELSKLKTLHAIIDWILERTGGGTAAGTPIEPKTDAPRETSKGMAAETRSQADASSAAVPRMLLNVHELPGTNASTGTLTGGCIVITDDGTGVAKKLAERLSADGMSVEVVVAGSGEGGNGHASRVNLTDVTAAKRYLEKLRRKYDRVVGIVHLTPLASAPAQREDDLEAIPQRLHIELHTLFNLVQAAEDDLRRTPAGIVLSATRMGGTFAATKSPADLWPGSGGVCGLVKSIAREWPEVSCKTLDFAADADSAGVSEAIAHELVARGGPTEVGHLNGRRVSLKPASSVVIRDEARVSLGAESVVLVTGGARGITAEVAIELAKRFGCKLVLVGRSPVPASEEPTETTDLVEARDVKAAIMNQLRSGGATPTPKDVETAFRKLMADREIRENVAAMRAAGATVEYHVADVADAHAFGTVIDDLYARLGRIDGVVHGAGVIEDKLIRDKTIESFDRVVNPKVRGAVTLATRLRPETLSFMFFFSSVSARYGNRGQCDYAAANEVLNKLAGWLNQRWSARVASLNWGPWESTGGMVSAELAKRFADAGVHVISRPAGREAFVDELLYGHEEDVEVVFGGPLDGLMEVADHVAVGRTGGNSAVAAHLPLLSTGAEVVSNGSTKREITRLVDPKQDVYLWDHQLEGTPVMPMAMMMEFLSEVGASIRPDLSLATICDLRVLRGITLEDGPRTVRAEASDVVETSSGVDVKLRVGCLADKPDLRYTATVQLAKSTGATQLPAKLELVNRKPLPISLEEAYATWLFHGPLFAGIKEVAALGDNGIIATLRPSVVAECFADGAAGAWLIDPVLVDSALQMVILWARTYRDMTPLPAGVTCYHRFGPPPAGDVHCEVAVRCDEGNPAIFADLMFYDAGGRLFGWLENMQGTCSKALNRLGTAKPNAAEVRP